MSALDKAFELAFTIQSAAGRPIRCLKCLSEIQSLSLDDLQQCKCGDVRVSGGSENPQMGLMPGAAWCYSDEPEVA